MEIAMWQMTWNELLADSFEPVKEFMHIGSWAYTCPVCGLPVGIYRTDEGFILKRDECKNHHKIKWT